MVEDGKVDGAAVSTCGGEISLLEGLRGAQGENRVIRPYLENDGREWGLPDKEGLWLCK